MTESVLRDYRSEARDAAAPKRLYIFFHGHGGSGEAMRQCLTASLQEADPGAILRCPDGPRDLGWQSRSWCDVEPIDFITPTPKIMARRIAAGRNETIAYIRAAMDLEQVSGDQVVLGGHSLGATAAVDAGLGMADQVAGIFSLSGGALDCIEDIKSHPPVMIAAGIEEDNQHNSYYCGVPHTFFAQAFLKAHGIPAERRSLPGREHNMCDDTGSLMAEFGKRVAPIRTCTQCRIV